MTSYNGTPTSYYGQPYQAHLAQEATTPCCGDAHQHPDVPAGRHQHPDVPAGAAPARRDRAAPARRDRAAPAPRRRYPLPRSPIIGAAALPRAVSPGRTEHLGTRVSSTSAQSNLIVDFEVYDSTGSKVYQTYHSGASLAAGAPQTFVANWPVPAGQAAGSYTLKVGVFNATWTQTYAWDDQAATFRVR